MTRYLNLIAVFLFCGSFVNAGTLTLICNTTSADDPDTYAAGTCAYLQNTVAAYYDNAFTNVNATILIQMGSTSLGESEYDMNEISYAQYSAALAANAAASGNAIQQSASASLTNDVSPYGGGEVDITSALAAALDVSSEANGGTGTMGLRANGSTCFSPGTAKCFDGIVTIATPAYLSAETSGTQGLYWDQNGGTEPGNDYDLFGVVQHEIDEVLGTASCIGTLSTDLTDGCPGINTPSAADLFRYQGAGNLSLTSTAAGTADGGSAYFSYDGGVTNGANGFYYNSAANGDDYGDFLSACGTGPYTIQDAQGCPGTEQGVSILNDGGAEMNILDADGYEETPEPGTVILFGGGLAALIAYRRYASNDGSPLRPGRG